MTRGQVARRDWAIMRESRAMVCYVLAVDAVAILWALVALDDVRSLARWGVGGWSSMLLIIALAVVYEEIAVRLSRLRWRISSELKHEMGSVWAVATAVVLAPSLIVVTQVVLFLHVWFRQERPAGEILYRKICSHATVLIGSLSAAAAAHQASVMWAGAPWQLTVFYQVLVAVVVYTLVNRGLVTIALLLLGVRDVKALLATADDNLHELATLCLGGLVAVALLHAQWVCVLVLPVMFVLQRSGFVRELETAATTDAKTGLLNAIAWEQVARRELERAGRELQPLSVLILDLDRFKVVNDQFGHLAGDHVLRGLGRVLESSIREYDTPGRFGGEEFVAVLPGADVRTAAAIAERVRGQIAQFCVADFVPTASSQPRMGLSASIGVACGIPGAAAEITDLLHAADRALYRAKAGGRDQVRIANEGDELPIDINIS